MILRARLVLPMSGAPIDDGGVAIEGERIAEVGRFGDLRASRGGEVTDLGEQMLLPGLINAHCHLDYTCLRGKIRRQRSFTDWIRAINRERSAFSHQGYVDSINSGFREAREFGATSIVNLTGVPELIARTKPTIRTWWAPELIDVRPGTDSLQLVQRAREAVRETEFRGIAPHAPYTASADIYRAANRFDGAVRTTHVAESFEELQMFRFASGALYDFLAHIGRDMADCGSQTAFARALELCPLNRTWLFAHVNELTSNDWPLIENAGTLHVVHCPRSHRYFQHTSFAYERLRDSGANICIGTDSLASAPDLSLLAELREFRRLRPHVSARETLEMITLNPARAIGQPYGLGQLGAGAFADMIALPFCGEAADAYEAIIAAGQPIRWMMLGGTVI